MSPRFSIAAEFFVTADNAQDAETSVANFVDAFPSQVDGDADGDVILQGPAVEDYE